MSLQSARYSEGDSSFQGVPEGIINIDTDRRYYNIETNSVHFGAYGSVLALYLTGIKSELSRLRLVRHLWMRGHHTELIFYLPNPF